MLYKYRNNNSRSRKRWHAYFNDKLRQAVTWTHPPVYIVSFKNIYTERSDIQKCKQIRPIYTSVLYEVTF